MRAIGDILKDSDQRLLHIICFASMPDWPMAASTGLLKMSVFDAQISCLPVIGLCFFYCFSGCALVMTGDLWKKISSAAMVATAFLQIVFMWIAYEKISEFMEKKEGA